MERAADHEIAMMTDRVRPALAAYGVPEGLDEAGIAKLRTEVSNQATFDYSKEATLARKYEAASNWVRRPACLATVDSVSILSSVLDNR